MIEVARVLLEDILRQGRVRYPGGACGVLLGTPGDPDAAADPTVVEASRPGRPEADSCAGPSAEDVEAAGREGATRGLAVVGTWHTHPDAAAEPSPADLAGGGPGRVELIVSVRKGQAAEWACWTEEAGLSGLRPVIVKLTG